MASRVGRRETALHEAMVLSLIQYFRKQGWTVTAAARAGFAEPHALGQHEPDVLGTGSDGTVIIGEAKTGEGDLATKHSKEQYVAFSNRVMTNSRKFCPFYLSVPREQQEEISQILRQLGLLTKANVHLLTYGQ